MKQLLPLVLLGLVPALAANAQADTLRVSSLFTTHVIFSSDVTYADLSNSRTIAAKIVEQNKNMIALKAKEAFTDPCSVSALESNGRMWTFIVVFDENPDELIIDTRDETGKGSAAEGSNEEGRRRKQKTASTWKDGDAPTLEDVFGMKRRVHHIGSSGYDLLALCENLYSYSDITYMTLSLENRSGISYQIANATFVIESRKKSKRTVEYDQTIFPKSRYGNLSAEPGGNGKIVYSFDKLTLSDDQVLRIYLYESGGQRNLVMSVTPDDINRARNLER